jgi:hypothetical protein
VRRALTFPSYPPAIVLLPGAAEMVEMAEMAEMAEEAAVAEAEAEAGVVAEAVAVAEAEAVAVVAVVAAVTRCVGECSGEDVDIRCALVRSGASLI